MDVEAIAAQLQEIERRYAPAGGGAEARAKQLADWREREREEDREDACTMPGPTEAWLLVRLCSKYGIKTFRRPRQKPTTVTLLAPPRFVSKIVWPQLREMAAVFEHARRAMVDDIATAWLGSEANEVLFVEEPKTR